MSPPGGRTERKYLADETEVEILAARLRGALRPDPHGEGGSYHVRSLYFDDLLDTALFEKLSGVRDRHKWRLRIYDRSDARIRLERKARRDRLVRKEAALVDRATAERMIAGDAPVDHAAPLVRAFAAEQRARRLRPVIVVDYRRSAWLHRAGDVRVTLDRRLASGGAGLDLFDPRLPTIPLLDLGDGRRTIVEVKSTGLLPLHVAALLPRSLQGPAALSKYVLCRRPVARLRWEDP